MAAEPRVRRGSLRLTSPELLRALMNRWDYSLADVATVAGTHRSAIDHLLHGRPNGLRQDRAMRVAAALRVDLETQIEGAGDLDVERARSTDSYVQDP